MANILEVILLNLLVVLDGHGEGWRGLSWLKSRRGGFGKAKFCVGGPCTIRLARQRFSVPSIPEQQTAESKQQRINRLTLPLFIRHYIRLQAFYLGCVHRFVTIVFLKSHHVVTIQKLRLRPNQGNP
jgi:hypothetical protein